MRTFVVWIHKSFFPKHLQPTGPDEFDRWQIIGASRKHAAELAWAENGERLLALMGPRKTRGPRKVSLFVSDPSGGAGGLSGRLPPITVYRGD